MTFSIRRKLLLAFLGLSALSLLAVGYLGVSRLREMGRFALESSSALGRQAMDDSARALSGLGESVIKRTASAVAKQIEIYLKLNPAKTVADLQRDDYFQAIAVQKVGETGYTSVMDTDTGYFYFHPQAGKVNTDTHALKDTLPAVWAILSATIGEARDSAGYYEWKESDGSIRPKYMALACVSGETADGHHLFVAATTYIDEFLKPVTETKAEIQAATAGATRRIDRQITAARSVFLGVCAFLLAVVIVLSVSLSGKITRPIHALTRGAKALGAGDLETRVEVRTGDEIEELARSFNTMAADLKTHTEELKRATAERERLEKELEIARGIQQSFLPDDVPHVPGIEIAAVTLPAREVGGDFYDFIPLSGETWGLAIADVSGKGVPAAIFMALSRTLIRATASGPISPALGLRHANDLILADSRSCMFVTLFYAVLNGAEKTLRYVNAGHNPPLLLKPGEADVVLLRAEGIALGVLENIQLKEAEIRLDPGDVIALYTDGVTEAINARGEQFGQERLARTVAENRGLAAGEILARVKAAVTAFAGDQPQFDDITLMILKVN